MSSYNRQHGTSPTYSYSNSAEISASAITTIDLEIDFPQSQKYMPLNMVNIINNSQDCDIKIYINQSENSSIVIARKSTVQIDKAVFPAIRSFKVENLSSDTAIAIGELNILSWKEGVTFESVFQRMHRRLSGE